VKTLTTDTHPYILGEWVVVDDSDNTLEFAPTSRTGLVALRSSYNPAELIFVTEKQLMSLMDAMHQGKISALF
jgi:hypothetical protein